MSRMGLVILIADGATFNGFHSETCASFETDIMMIHEVDTDKELS